MYIENLAHHNWLIKKLLNEKILARVENINGRVLDLGCGTKPFEEDVLKYANHYVGVDWGNSLHQLEADIVTDLNKPLPLPDESFDNIISFEVIEHLCEPQLMLNEAFRVLTPGGSIIYSAPFMWWLHEAPWDFYRLTKFGHEYLLKKSGFVNIKIEPVSGFWSMWFLKLNYQTTRLIKGPRILRKFIRTGLIPFWFITQCAGLFFDKFFFDDRETTGYIVKARKP